MGGRDTFDLNNGLSRGRGGGELLVCEVVQGVVTPICTTLTVKTGVKKFFTVTFTA